MGGGGGVFELGTPEGRGPQAVLEIQVDGGWGGSKNRAFRHGGVHFFWNNPMALRNYFLVLLFWDQGNNTVPETFVTVKS